MQSCKRLWRRPNGIGPKGGWDTLPGVVRSPRLDAREGGTAAADD